MVYLNLQTDNIDIAEVLPLLPQWRQEQVMRFKHLQGRQLCAAAYLLLKEGLQKEYGISEKQEFVISNNGKPQLKDHPDIYFNLSHSHQAAVCAISNRPIGIDIELIRNVNGDLIKYTMTDDEIAQIKEPADFFRLWTMKEAYLKLTGEGIHNNMQDVLNNTHNIEFQTFQTAGNYIYTLAQYR